MMAIALLGAVSVARAGPICEDRAGEAMQTRTRHAARLDATARRGTPQALTTRTAGTHRP